MKTENEKKIIGRNPDYKTDGVAVWINEDKNKDSYLSIRMVGHATINVFKNKSKDGKQ